MPRLAIPILSRGPFDNAPTVVATTISIRPSDDAPVHKVTKVTGYADGGFALLAPYHSAKSGVLTKRLVDYRTQTDVVSIAEMETFSASDRVKLSYKPDGFVQFSGEGHGRIASGRDPLTLEPKAVGIMTNPMTAPVMTGPAFGITLWGLSDFIEQEGKPRGDSLVFGPDDFVYDHCDAETWGSYGVSFFIFGAYFQPYVHKVGPTQFEIPLWHNQYHDDGGQFVFKVVRLGQQPFFLGAICFRRPPVGFDAPSGWSIGGPGALSTGPIKETIHAFYPADGWPSPPTGTVDLEEWQAAQPEASTAPQFASDYGGMIERSEAQFALRATRELPRLGLIRDGAGLLAEIMDGPVLVPADLHSRPGRLGSQQSLSQAMPCALHAGARSFSGLGTREKRSLFWSGLSRPIGWSSSSDRTETGRSRSNL